MPFFPSLQIIALSSLPLTLPMIKYGSYMHPRPVMLSQELSEISSEPFSGIIQIGLLPDSDSKNKDVLTDSVLVFVR